MHMSPEEILFFVGKPEKLETYETIRKAVLSRFPDVKIEVKKTQISFKARRLFAMVSLPRAKTTEMQAGSIVLTIGLRRAAEHPLLLACVEPYPNRFTHHLRIACGAQMDESVMALLDEAYAFAV